MCSSSTLQEKSEKDWSVFLKCDNGKYTSINSTYDKCLFSKNHFYCVFKTLLVFSEAGMILANYQVGLFYHFHCYSTPTQGSFRFSF